MLKKAHKNNFSSNLPAFIFIFIFSVFILHSLVFPLTLTFAEPSNNASSNSSTSANPSYSSSSEVGINVKEFIKLAIDKSTLQLEDGNGNTNISPSPSGTQVNGTVNVAVTTNVLKGYSLSVLTQDTTTSMINNHSAVNTAITPTASGASTLSSNTWGFQKPGDLDHWYPVGEANTSGTEIYHKSQDDAEYCSSLVYPIPASCPASSYDTYAINFGVKLSSSLPAGTYSNSVVFSAITNPDGVRYSLNFNGNGGSGSMAPRTIMAGSTITMPSDGFTKKGQSIKGWALTPEANTPATVGTGANAKQLTTGQTDVDVTALILAAEAASQSPTTTGITLYAIWDNTYTFTYIADAPSTATVTGTTSSNDNLLTNNATISTNGYTDTTGQYSLIGWSLTSGQTTVANIAGIDLVSGASNIPTSSIITAAATAGQDVSTTTGGSTVRLYGVWSLNTYTVTITSGDHISTTTGSNDYTVGDTVTISATPATGYHFSGWTISEGSVVLSPNTTTSPATFAMPDSDVTLTANGALNSFTLDYNANGGSGTTSSQTVTYGTNVTLRSNGFTAPSGKKFKQWGTSTSGGTTYSAGASVAPTTLKSDITTTNGGLVTLYAIWEDDILNCSSTVHPTTTTGCRMADGRIWILGNSGNTIAWNSMFTGATGVGGHDATVNSGICPAGYSAPKITDFDRLIQAYGGTKSSGGRLGYREDTGALYSVLGLSGDRYYWSSTEYDIREAYYLFVYSGGSRSMYLENKTYYYYVLCYQ